MTKINGDFSAALNHMILQLKQHVTGYSSKSVAEILEDWDSMRGNDWFTETSLWRELDEVRLYNRLKGKFEQ